MRLRVIFNLNNYLYISIFLYHNLKINGGAYETYFNFNILNDGL
jgi:hypothetical protein